MTELTYQSGFGNEFSTEALPGALPGTPAQMTAYTHAERERWGKLIRANNIKLD